MGNHDTYITKRWIYQSKNTWQKSKSWWTMRWSEFESFDRRAGVFALWGGLREYTSGPYCYFVDLRSSNEEYQQVEAEISALKQAHPFINAVIKGNDEIHLSAEEHSILIQYLRLYRKLDDMEREHIYLRGHIDTDAFAYLKKIKAL